MIASYTRTKLLREAMRKAGIAIYVLENSDPHQSEYLPDHWKEVEWLTGFKGEVATIILTADEAFLWTDSRFFISGAEQLKGSPFQLMKLKIAGVPTADEWLEAHISQLRESNPDAPVEIGGDFRTIQGSLRQRLTRDVNLISPLWKDRPALPARPVRLFPEALSGESTAERLRRIRLQAGLIDADGRPTSADSQLFLSALDEIAWSLNLRGSDIECTPVFLAFLAITADSALLYIDPAKITTEVAQYLSALGIEQRPYDEGLALATSGVASVSNPIPLMKGIKNPVEIEGFRRAMLEDGIALTRFYHWLEDTLTSEGEFTILPDGTFGISNEVTEMECVQRLIDFRRERPGYREESFPAIVAWNAHGAMPHYMPTAETDVPIVGDGLLLIDTGAHYEAGTTDITRTIGIGQVSEAMKRDFTLVLKGHIRLARAVFPTGTRGDQLDALARMDLWRDGKTYRHGTGHGVGHVLSVHEGPESVRMEHNPQPLIEGMLFSNEPAIYLGGQYGIRHENLVLVRPFQLASDAPDATPCNPAEQGDFLCLDTLTLCFIDTSCIDRDLLDRWEIEWLNNYNKHVFKSLASHLSSDDAAWLKEKTKAI